MEELRFNAKTIRTFIGAKNFKESRQFYKELGFEEIAIDKKMVLFKVTDTLSFYLQDAYVQEWVDNSMIFLEVDDVYNCWQQLSNKGLHHKYSLVKLSDIKTLDWGQECFLHDPSGVLWHFGKFNT